MARRASLCPTGPTIADPDTSVAGVLTVSGMLAGTVDYLGGCILGPDAGAGHRRQAGAAPFRDLFGTHR